MEAAVHAIEGRSRAFEVEPARLTHFTLSRGEAVGAGVALDEPGWSLYCLDFATRKAVFVQTGPEVDLADAPFMHLKQFGEARRVLIVPFAALDCLAERSPPPERMIFVFNIGRCGTTLVNAMLNEIPGVWSLSEPDVHFDLVMKRAEFDRAELLGLVRSTTRLLFRPPADKAVHTMAVKLRSQSLFQAGLFHQAFPDAVFLFMYRDGASWAKSFHRFMINLGVTVPLDGESRKLIWRICSAATDPGYLRPFLDFEREPLYPEELLGAAFALHADEYLRLLADGVPFQAIRYNELDRDRAAETAKLLAHCRLPADALPAALRAFEKDSQEGVVFGRSGNAAGYGEENERRFLATLARHPGKISPDVILPDVCSRPV